MRSLKKKLAIYSSYIVSLVFLYLTLDGIDYQELKNSLVSFEFKYIFLAGFVYLLTFILRGVRMRIVLDGKIPDRLAVSSNLISYALNNFIPLKGGDIYKIYFLNKQGGIRKSVSTASVLIERLFDLAAVLIIFIAMIYYLNLDATTWKITSLINVIVVLVILMAVMLYFVNKFKHINLENHIKFVSPDSLHVFIECWQRLLAHKHFASVFTLSMLVWLAEGLVFYIILDSDSLFIAFIWMSALALSFVIPNAPGNIGLFEWVSIFVLSRLGFGEEQALSMGLVVHAVQFVSVTAVGLLLFFYYKSKMRSLTQ